MLALCHRATTLGSVHRCPSCSPNLLSHSPRGASTAGLARLTAPSHPPSAHFLQVVRLWQLESALSLSLVTCDWLPCTCCLRPCVRFAYPRSAYCPAGVLCTPAATNSSGRMLGRCGIYSQGAVYVSTVLARSLARTPHFVPSLKATGAKFEATMLPLLRRALLASAVPCLLVVAFDNSRFDNVWLLHLLPFARLMDDPSDI
jgi:hypothetical protein